MNRGPRLFDDWRDFGREYVIVVLGVLTALAAQAAVEELSWRAKVRATTDDMRQELASGVAPLAVARLVLNRCVMDGLAEARTAVEVADRARANAAIRTLWLPVRTFDSAAWQNAVSSDISSHISTHDKYEFRIAYVMVPELDSVRASMLRDLAQLRSLPGSGGPLSQTEKQTALEAIANLETSNYQIVRASSFTLRHARNLGIGINRPQLRGNIAEARLHYRDCLITDGRVLMRMVRGETHDPR